MTELATQQEKSPEILKTRNVWAQMGEHIHLMKINLPLRTEQILDKLIEPKTFNDVPAAEAALKEVKRELKLLKDERILATNKFDDLKQTLSEPEKQAEQEVKEFELSIITIKKQKEEADRKEQAKKDEIKSIREGILLSINSIDSSLKTKVLTLVDEYYTKALNTNVLPEKIGAYLNQCNAEVTALTFSYEVTTPRFNTALVSAEEYIELFKEANSANVLNAAKYIESFRTKIDERFSDYSVAFKDKEAALKIASEEKAAESAKIEKQTALNNVSVQLSIAADEVSVEPAATKALKKSFEVDMVESLANSVIVMRAFVANMKLIEPMMKVNKWDSFNIGQMKNYLGKCKSNDNNFSVEGISFKEVTKL